MKSVETLVQQLNLLPHPEGGWYAETYRSPETLIKETLPGRFNGNRSFSTAIYFLLPAGVFSAFHRIQSDECWHFYEGDPLNIYVIDNTGILSVIKLGSNLLNGETFQAVVPAGCWFASKPSINNNYSLVGCTVAPGFDFADFELADGAELSAIYPIHTALINSLCR
ncbi:MAG: cupin domain-containing protein [Bacteroidota bacterium]